MPVTEIFCYRYSTINNSTNKQHFVTKAGDRFNSFFGIKCTKFYLDLFRFHISVVQCLGGYFFPDTVYVHCTLENYTDVYLITNQSRWNMQYT